MGIDIDIPNLILLFSCVNGILFSVLALFNARSGKSNYFVPVLLLCVSFMLFDEFSRWTKDFFTNYPEFTFLTTFAWFLVVPLIFMLVRYQAYRITFRWYDPFHLTALGVELILDENFFTLPPETKQQYLDYLYQFPEAHHAKIIFGTQIIIYSILIYRLIKNKYGFTGLEVVKNMSNWLKSIFVLYALYLLSIVIFIFSYEVAEIHLRWLDISKTYLFLIIIYGWLMYSVIDPAAFRYPVNSIRNYLDSINYEALSDELKTVVDYLEKEKPYLAPDLNTTELAGLLLISEKRLNRLVQKQLKISVPDLICIFRIEELERKYISGNYKNYSLVGLAKMSGFPSKTSFYRSFKEATGETPKKYLETRNLEKEAP